VLATRQITLIIVDNGATIVMGLTHRGRGFQGHIFRVYALVQHTENTAHTRGNTQLFNSTIHGESLYELFDSYVPVTKGMLL
jgi:hypothetical protein